MEEKRDWFAEAKTAARAYNAIVEGAVMQAHEVAEAAAKAGSHTPESVGKEVSQYLDTMSILSLLGLQMIASLAGLRKQLDESKQAEIDSSKPVPDDVKGLADEFLSKFKKDLH